MIYSEGADDRMYEGGKLLRKTNVQGATAEGFEQVREEFTAVVVKEQADPGAQLAVYVNGRLVIDLWAGSQVTGDSLTGVLSSSKGATYLVVALLVQEGVLTLDQTVAHFWPEFEAEGKADITPANAPEASVTEAISADLDWQETPLKELHIDRAYLSSHLVREGDDELAIYCKAWPVRTGKRFSKQMFTRDLGSADHSLSSRTGDVLCPRWRCAFFQRHLLPVPVEGPMHHQHKRTQCEYSS
jgi:hypothetical protein